MFERQITCNQILCYRMVELHHAILRAECFALLFMFLLNEIRSSLQGPHIVALFGDA